MIVKLFINLRISSLPRLKLEKRIEYTHLVVRRFSQSKLFPRKLFPLTIFYSKVFKVITV